MIFIEEGSHLRGIVPQELVAYRRFYLSLHILNKEHGISAQELINQASARFERKMQRRHEFWILTCYLDLSLIEKVILELVKTVKVKDVFLAFNFSEIYKAGPKSTSNTLENIKARLHHLGINFDWTALSCRHLVHSKGYAIIQRSNRKISDGLVLTTSGNFTAPGFLGGNVELGYLSTGKKDLAKFEHAYDYLLKKLGCSIDSAIFKEDGYLLKFAILSSGVFLHKWSGNLRQYSGPRFQDNSLRWCLRQKRSRQ